MFVRNMTETATSIALGIQEVLTQILTELKSPAQLCACARVNKFWYATTSRLLWRGQFPSCIDPPGKWTTPPVDDFILLLPENANNLRNSLKCVKFLDVWQLPLERRKELAAHSTDLRESVIDLLDSGIYSAARGHAVRICLDNDLLTGNHFSQFMHSQLRSLIIESPQGHRLRLSKSFLDRLAVSITGRDVPTRSDIPPEIVFGVGTANTESVNKCDCQAV